MYRKTKKTRFAMACALGAAVGFCAHAQEPVAVGEDETSRDATTLDRIVVTAQKRSENLMEVPAGISVVGEDRLESLNAGQLTDFAAFVPGFQVDSGGAPGKTSLAIRGIAPLGSSASVGTYIDETPLGSSGNYQRSTNFSLDLLPYDIEGVEVLRGPQGTLYGASSMGGLFKYITRAADPDHIEFRAGIDMSAVEGASGAGTGARFAFNVPIVEGRIGLRASFARKDTPGYIDNGVTGERSQNDFDQTASRLALFWQLSEHATLRLQSMLQRARSSNDSQVALDPLGQQPLYGEFINNNAMPEPYRNDLEYHSAILDWDLGWADFVSATSYSDNQMVQDQDGSAVYGPLFPLFGFEEGLADFGLELGLRKWTQEFRLVSKSSDRFEWLAGAFFTEETAENTQLLTAYDNDGVLIEALYPLAIAALPSTFREQAVFTDVTYKFNPKFDLSLGARVARNKQDFAQITTGVVVGEENAPGNSSETVDTYKLASRWYPGDDSMLYARIATGYRAGGPNLAWPGVPSMVESDSSTNYELGLKTSFLGSRGMLDLAVFQIDWEDMQIGALDGGISYLANGGGARSRGVEMSMQLRPRNNVLLGVNAAYIDAVLDDSVPESSGLVPGSRMPMTPKLSWSTTAEYTFDVGDRWDARVGGVFRHVGDRIGLQGFEIDEYRSLDLHADLSNGLWTARLFVRNATDETAYLSMSPVINGLTGAVAHVNGVVLQPRTVGISLEYRY